MFSAELVIGCVWGGEKLVCDANEGFTLLSQKIHYEITFGIPSHEPGTFRCNYSPSENDVIAQPCSLTLKGEALHPVVTRVHRDRDKTDLLLKYQPLGFSNTTVSRQLLDTKPATNDLPITPNMTSVPQHPSKIIPPVLSDSSPSPIIC